MGETSIQWTDVTWNPVRGCSRVSPGCGGGTPGGGGGCYAERIAARFSGPGMAYEGLAEMTPEGGRWTGKVRLVDEMVGLPLRWRRPRRVFVNSMSDLFHEALSNEEIATAFGVMAAAPQHTFQVLTKRAGRMVDWFRWAERHHYLDGSAGIGGPLCALWEALSCFPGSLPGLDAEGDEGEQLSRALDRDWPLPNVWLGVSVENQKYADERVPRLLAVPAAVRFLSCEPLLGPIDLGLYPFASGCGPRPIKTSGLDWCICGGESGPKARPFNLAWARSLRDQCAAAGVAYFFKQAGANVFNEGVGLLDDEDPGAIDVVRVKLNDRKGGDLDELPADLRVRQFPKPHSQTMENT